MPMLAGNIVSLLSPFFITVPISLMYPQNFDFESTKNISVIEDEKDQLQVEYDVAVEEDPIELEKASRFAYAAAWTLTGVLIFLFPLPLLGEKYIFSDRFALNKSKVFF